MGQLWGKEMLAIVSPFVGEGIFNGVVYGVEDFLGAPPQPYRTGVWKDYKGGEVTS